MTKLFFLIIASAFGFAPLVKDSKIEGRLQFADPVKMVYLNYRGADGQVNDSTALKNGRFSFTVNIEEPVLAAIIVRFDKNDTVNPRRFERLSLFIEPGKINVVAKDSLRFAKVTGSKAHDEFVRLQKLQKPFQDNSRELSKQYYAFRKDKNEEGVKRIEEEMDKLERAQKREVLKPYLEENINSPISLYVLSQYAGYDIDAEEIEPFFDRLPVSIRNWPSARKFAKQIEIAKKTAVGVNAMDFTQADTSGVPVSLSSFKGKYVLLDFWASWCGPCRTENPNVVKAFQNYKDKGFTVLGVSLDRPGRKEDWLNAIHKDNLTWTHVSDLKFWDNEVARQYGIQAIPQNFLIDPSGKIIAKNIKGDELQKKLSEVLK